MTSRATPRRRLLVCEDGDEYLLRFSRFLSTHYVFEQARNAVQLLALARKQPPALAVLLDLDFRRTPESELVDGDGRNVGPLSEAERRQLISNQGIAILAELRRAGCTLPALLFADVETARSKFLVERFAPLNIVPSHGGLRELQQRLSLLAQQ